METNKNSFHSSVGTRLLYDMLRGGYDNLMLHRSEINDLNVFPVPDGDTGMNMSATLLGGLGETDPALPVPEFLTSFSKGALMAARGNSGVILSQFIRGFAEGASGAESFDTAVLESCMKHGCDRAYSSVVNPVEGTMLTVIRQSSEHLSGTAGLMYLEDAFRELITTMEVSLENTPNLLPVLKEAGVVDSGGAGVLCVFKGMNEILLGRKVEDAVYSKSIAHELAKAQSLHFSAPSSEFGYCTEFILELDDPEHAEERSLPLKQSLELLGDSLVFVTDGDLLKVHVHTMKPEKALALAHALGEFVTVKIENMTKQHKDVIARKKKDKIKKHIALVEVASGAGIKDYLYSAGTDVIIDGGQTSNPSTSDFIKAFESVEAGYIIVMPNNSNVIMTAKQAASMYKNSDVRVIETASVAEGISALSMIDKSVKDVEAVISTIRSCIDRVITAYVTTATRDTVMNGIKVVKDDYIGVEGDSILSCSPDKTEAAKEALRKIPGIADKEVLTVIYGKDVDDGEAESLVGDLQDEYPLYDVVAINGKQDVYSLIISAE